MFKKAFKQYKNKTSLPDLTGVIDVDIYETCNPPSGLCNLLDPKSFAETHIQADLQRPVGLQPQHLWRCYTFKKHPGLLLIRNPFTCRGQRYWIARSLRDYPLPPNVVNLDLKHFSPKILSDWWGELQLCTDPIVAQRVKTAMRWTTLGYHHNWDTKVYDETRHAKFPCDLENLTQYFSLAGGFGHFKPEAAIVNYYPIGTTLSGHTDHSEINHRAPLFSFSFGQAAIFLIGQRTLEEEPSALLLRSGDVLVMSEESRLCYHAVPRVMEASEDPWNDRFLTDESQEDIRCSSMDLELYKQVNDNHFWLPFNRYITDSRININVRQVFS